MQLTAKKILITTLLLLSLMPTAFANTTNAINNSNASPNNKRIDLSLIEVTPHELALTQVLAEICPAMLKPSQKNQFFKAYNTQLQIMMPKLEPKAVLDVLKDNYEYQKILKSIRTWTMTYPAKDNEELCVQFAESKF